MLPEVEDELLLGLEELDELGFDDELLGFEELDELGFEELELLEEFKELVSLVDEFSNSLEVVLFEVSLKLELNELLNDGNVTLQLDKTNKLNKTANFFFILTSQIQMSISTLKQIKLLTQELMHLLYCKQYSFYLLKFDMLLQ